MARLIEHSQERHAPPGGQLLRYRNGRPITSRRYEACGLASAVSYRGSAPSRSACTGYGTPP